MSRPGAGERPGMRKDGRWSHGGHMASDPHHHHTPGMFGPGVESQSTHESGDGSDHHTPNHGDHPSHGGHGHGAHAGHHTEQFRRRFWWSLLLTIPVVATSHMVMDWFGY